MILGASGGALLAVQAAETETETVLTGEVQMSGSRSAAWGRRRLIVGVGPESNIQIKEAGDRKPGYQVRVQNPRAAPKVRKSEQAVRSRAVVLRTPRAVRVQASPGYRLQYGNRRDPAEYRLQGREPLRPSQVQTPIQVSPRAARMQVQVLRKPSPVLIRFSRQ